VALATVLNRYTALQTPIRLEFILVSAPSSGDTVYASIQNAQWVVASTAGVTGQMVNPSATIDPDTKLITIGSSNGKDNLGLIVVGF